jgi:hypothetical protein
MSGFEGVAVIVGFVASSAACIKIAITIYKDVKDTSKVPPTLQKVAGRLSIIIELLDNAKEQADNKRPNVKAWQDSEACLRRCEEGCKELQSLFEKAFPQQPNSTQHRLWKSIENVITSKGRKAEELFRDIYLELEFLSKKQIVTSCLRTSNQPLTSWVVEMMGSSSILAREHRTSTRAETTRSTLWEKGASSLT